MPAPKIVKFKGKSYFECLWTGVKLESAYILPEFDLHGNRSKGGSFADCACAVAWVNSFYKGNKKKRELLLGVARDLSLALDQELLEAPECPPIEEYDFSYRNKYPYIFRPDLHVSVDEALSWKEEKPDEETEKKAPPRRTVAYALDGEPTPLPTFRGSLFYCAKMDGVVFSVNSGAPNVDLLEKTGVEAYGDCCVILSKRPNDWKETSNDKRKRAEGGGLHDDGRTLKIAKI